MLIGHYHITYGLQRKAIRIMAGLQCRNDCRYSFKNLKVLTIFFMYILQCLIHFKLNPDNYINFNVVHKHDI